MNESFGERVRSAREALGWSQETLADKVGTTQSTIQRIENDDSKRSRYMIEVSTLLGIALPSAIPVERSKIKETQALDDGMREILEEFAIQLLEAASEIDLARADKQQRAAIARVAVRFYEDRLTSKALVETFRPREDSSEN